MANTIHRTRAEEIALGMTLLGLLFSSILYGISLSQTYTYHKRFPRDSYSVKLLVMATVILNTASVAFEFHACWYYLVTSGPMAWAVWSLDAEVAVSMIISCIAETFMIYRVWMLSSRRCLLTGALLLFALLHLTSGEVSASQFIKLRRFSQFETMKASVPSIIRLGSASVCDAGIAVSLCYFLQQKRTGYKRTDEIIDRLMMFSINSGLITSVASIACLVTYVTIPKTWVYFTLCFLISRLYSNTFLCALNSRKILQSDESDMDTPALPRFTRSRRLTGRLSEKLTTISRPITTQIDVFVSRETVTTSEDAHNSSSKTSARSVKTRFTSSQSSGTIERSARNSDDSLSNYSVHSAVREVPRVMIRE